MQMQLRTPVARCQHAIPRCASQGRPSSAAFHPTAAFTQSTQHLRSSAVSRKSLRRAERLQVQAAGTAKKSVGDLSKADLEGKTVFVSPSWLRPASLTPASKPRCSWICFGLC